MPFPIRLAALAFAAAITATGAGAGWVEPGAKADASSVADMIINVVSKAALKKAQRPKIVLLWRTRPDYLDDLRQMISDRMPQQYSVEDWSLPFSPPYEESLRKRWSADVVCIVAVELEPDALHVLSQFSRSHDVLTIGTDDDVDPLGVGLRLKGTTIYCSMAALKEEKVTIGDPDLCRPLPQRRTALAGDLRLAGEQGTRAFEDYIRAREKIEAAWKLYGTQLGRATTSRQPIDEAAHVMQHDVGIKPDEGTLSSGRGGRLPEAYLAHYELSRAFYLVGNCEAVRLELPKIDPSL
ncbi:MAG TPA: hypothetical protein VGR02_22345, partial [Thermoanaerobaculia bacterium]|nr:hypothetical protein [Thermoanaerobaculia bacterium]